VVNKNHEDGCQLLTPVILAIWEAEIRRITFQTQSGKKVSKTTFQPLLGAVACSCHPRDDKRHKTEEDSGPGWPRQKVMPYLQNNESKKGFNSRAPS
jgi:hypothetical protein